MNAAKATFEVRDVIFVEGRSDTFIAGIIKEGSITTGMYARVDAGDGAAISARINDVGHIRNIAEKNIVSLSLDTPELGSRQNWKDYCHSGDMISIETMANQSPDPTLASGTPPAGQESRHP